MNQIDHEVRLRNLEEFLKQIKKEMDYMQSKIDSQFNLIAGTILTSGIGIVLHMTKLL